MASAEQLFQQIWTTEFAPKLVDRLRRESERQTEAFLDVALTLCGEEVRQMTPHDMLHLDALGNPFIAGSTDGVTLFDCAAFLWQLAVENTHTTSIANLWRRHRLLRRVAALDLDKTAQAIGEYVDRMLMDTPADRAAAPKSGLLSDGLAKQPKCYFLTPLMVTLSAEMGHIDPMSGEILAHTPLPRLIQYSRSIGERNGADKTYTDVDSLRNQCMARVNQILAEQRAAEATAVAATAAPA